MFRIRTILLAALALPGALALAGRTMTIIEKDGKKRVVELESFDDAGLTYEQGGSRETVAWNELAPRSAYEVRKALTPFDDAVQRRKLSRFAAERHLYPEAIEQLEIAAALGGIDEAGYEKRERELREAEILYLRLRIDKLLASKAEPEACLAAIKRLKERYPNNEATRAYEPRIQELVDRIAKRKQAALDKKEQKKVDREFARLQRRVAKEDAERKEDFERGEKLFKESDEAIEMRQVSRIKKKLLMPRGAERYYKKARRHLRNLARIDREGRVIPKAELQKQYDLIGDRLVECYLRVARSSMRQRNYKSAAEFVRKVLYYDPINEEALDMVEEIRKNRITFKLSEITNARPRVTGG